MRRRLQERPGTVIVPLAIAFFALAVTDYVLGDATLHGVIVTVAGLGGAAIIAIGLAVHRPVHAKAWWLIGGALALLGVGFACFYGPTWFGHDSPAAPSLPDALWVLLYPLLLAGLAIKIVRRRSHVGAMIDLATMTLAAITVMGPLLIGPFIHEQRTPAGPERRAGRLRPFRRRLAGLRRAVRAPAASSLG